MKSTFFSHWLYVKTDANCALALCVPENVRIIIEMVNKYRIVYHFMYSFKLLYINN